jgi:general L-amino acid transport system permease protein
VNPFVRDTPIPGRAPPVSPESLPTRLLRQAFSSAPNAIVTLACAAVAGYVIYVVVTWGLIDARWSGDSAAACKDADGACWAYVIARWKVLLAGAYPAAALWRVYVAFALVVATIAWLVAPRLPFKLGVGIAGVTLVPVAAGILLAGGVLGLTPAPTSTWGGFLVTVIVALVTLVTALPLGLLLALGRRARLPVVSFLCIGYIELMRGIPLLAILFVAATIFPLFLPAGTTTDLFTRTLVAFTLFNAAMAAEVFRGGLQSVGRGQYEAATTVGLTPTVTMFLIVLPQAIRTVVPALINVMISIIKETTVLLVIGVVDFVEAVRLGVDASNWLGGPDILNSGFVFAALVYVAICFSLSKYADRFERRY